jgi:hypothetical protein
MSTNITSLVGSLYTQLASLAGRVKAIEGDKAAKVPAQDSRFTAIDAAVARLDAVVAKLDAYVAQLASDVALGRSIAEAHINNVLDAKLQGVTARFDTMMDERLESVLPVKSGF